MEEESKIKEIEKKVIEEVGYMIRDPHDIKLLEEAMKATYDATKEVIFNFNLYICSNCGNIEIGEKKIEEGECIKRCPVCNHFIEDKGKIYSLLEKKTKRMIR